MKSRQPLIGFVSMTLMFGGVHTAWGWDPLYFQRSASSQDWLWTNPLNWLHGEGGAYPTYTNNVYVNAGSSEQPVVIPVGATAWASSLRLGGTAAGSSGYVSVEGVLSNRTDLTLGAYSGKTGWMRVASEGGVYSSGGSLTVGKVGTGVIRQAGGEIRGFQNVYLGDTTSVSGIYTATGGTFSANFLCIGRYGRGVVTNDGGNLVVTGSIAIPWHPGSQGMFVHKAGTLAALGDNGIQVGYQGDGRFDATCNFAAPVLRVGLDGGTGTVSLGACLYSNIWQSASIVWPVVVGGERDAAGGFGTFWLRDATVSLCGKKGIAVRATQDSAGVLRGWGFVTNQLAAVYEDNYVLLNNGLVIADGEGTERDLDFSHMLAASNSLANAAGETNGWYAVNKGRLVFPGVNFASAGASPIRNYGASTYGNENFASAPVNSVRAAFHEAEIDTGALIPGTSNRYARYGGELYAPDRADIPAGLPDKGVLAVWRLTSPGFGSVDLSFRYDSGAMSEGAVASLCRRGADEVCLSGVDDGLLCGSDHACGCGTAV
jgi:hypothetical protein